jgi:hypothetical protein
MQGQPRGTSACNRAPGELEGCVLRHRRNKGVLLQGEVEAGDAAFRPSVLSGVFF